MGFDLDRQPVVRQGYSPQLVKEHGLSHTTQSAEQQGPTVTAQFCSSYQEDEGINFSWPAHQEEWRNASSRAVGVEFGFHPLVMTG